MRTREKESAWLRLLPVAAVAIVMLACARAGPPPEEAPAMSSMTLKSTAFEPGAPIPARHTCDGEDVSPELRWDGVPQGTGSLALVADDPDAPMGTWVHWVLFDLPAGATGLPEGVPAVEVPDGLGGARQGTNDFRRIGWGGPCPPPGGPHRYFFRLYALDGPLGLKPGASRKEVDAAMRGRILGSAELMGTYARRR